MSEKSLRNKILLNLHKSCRLFRNNVAKGWIGKTFYDSKTNTATINNARRLHAGLCKGSSDLIGWTSIEITEEMVGQKIAVFTAFELKTPKDTPKPEQLNFIEQIKKNGGFAGVVRNYDDAAEIITWKKSEI